MEDHLTETEKGVLQAYDQSLIISVQPPRKLFILCPVGLVGAGKTTVVKPLAERLSLVRLSGDEIRKLLHDRGMGYELMAKARHSLIEKYLAAGFSVVVDSDCASPRNQEIIKEAEKEYGVLPIWIHINPPENFILNKLRSIKHTWLFRDADHAIENYEKRKPLHQNLDLPFIYTFDPSRPDLESQIDQAIKLIEEQVRL